MKEDFSELIQYLDGKFTNIDRKLDSLQENKADKSDVRVLTNLERSDLSKTTLK